MGRRLGLNLKSLTPLMGGRRYHRLFLSHSDGGFFQPALALLFMEGRGFGVFPPTLLL